MRYSNDTSGQGADIVSGKFEVPTKGWKALTKKK